MDFDVGRYFENLSWIFMCYKNSTINKGNIHEDICSFVMKSHWILIRMRKVSDIICGDNETDIL